MSVTGEILSSASEVVAAKLRQDTDRAIDDSKGANPEGSWRAP
ncbi:hypothetical protein RAJCM14343_3202 [Rhodococcus aetherivorans]|uniref:Uncharacterized protein n=1 Tax=Rhodococcus aetherivorans TaxID=191292 RepID=A0ABQ0YMZ5_9NOCA|nr:hypothetical protein RR21198_5882 [Rhodococcus rhodochrous ATCC 21198]GES37942.1 hypothetical protein RAJCM14343_3202 [Rhodococcus aetherivorans]